MAALVLAFGAASGHTQVRATSTSATTAGTGGAFKFIGDAIIDRSREGKRREGLAVDEIARALGLKLDLSAVDERRKGT